MAPAMSETGLIGRETGLIGREWLFCPFAPSPVSEFEAVCEGL